MRRESVSDDGAGIVQSASLVQLRKTARSRVPCASCAHECVMGCRRDRKVVAFMPKRLKRSYTPEDCFTWGVASRA